MPPIEVYYIDANGGSPVDTIQATCQNINEEWHTCLSSTDKAFKKQMPSLASNSYNALVTVVINCNDENLPEDVEHLCKVGVTILTPSHPHTTPPSHRHILTHAT